MSDKISNIVVTTLLSMILAITGWIASNMYEISKSVAISTYQLKDHTLRIVSLEEWRREAPIPFRRRG